MKTNDIDFVITWVDDKDPVWREKRDLYKGIRTSEGNEDARYRDWDTLRYWFRGVEKFAPWVRHIYFVTDNQKPEWLNIDHPKLKWVKHTDYIPEEYLPTFNSNVIAWNFHRIQDLSENYVYFNDDVFLIKEVEATDFFVDGEPCEWPMLDYICPSDTFSYICMNNIAMINRNFNCGYAIKSHIKKWLKFQNLRSLLKLIYFGRHQNIPGMNVPHIHCNYKKKTVEKIWEKEYDRVHDTCTHRFRTVNDVSSSSSRIWNIMSGQFKPTRLMGKSFSTDSLNKSNAAIEYICKQKGKVVCINDNENEVNFELHKHIIIDAFEELLPEKSLFELW